jgi:hypothetical protein
MIEACSKCGSRRLPWFPTVGYDIDTYWYGLAGNSTDIT